MFRTFYCNLSVFFLPKDSPVFLHREAYGLYSDGDEMFPRAGSTYWEPGATAMPAKGACYCGVSQRELYRAVAGSRCRGSSIGQWQVLGVGVVMWQGIFN